ncbi:MAG: hypothetical protein JXX14_06700 [Deltaproteobacteria bacterium]|nr:hypothetical protein [Deltaproteobacteria bacterium]
MTKQQTLKEKKQDSSGVFLNERFVHRHTADSADSWNAIPDSDEIFERLAEYFAITQFDVFALSDSIAADELRPAIVDDLPRFRQLQRDGLQVPKEGKDGTGN